MIDIIKLQILILSLFSSSKYYGVCTHLLTRGIKVNIISIERKSNNAENPVYFAFSQQDCLKHSFAEFHYHEE